MTSIGTRAARWRSIAPAARAARGPSAMLVSGKGQGRFVVEAVDPRRGGTRGLGLLSGITPRPLDVAPATRRVRGIPHPDDARELGDRAHVRDPGQEDELDAGGVRPPPLEGKEGRVARL